MSEQNKIPPMTFTGYTWADEHRLPPVKATAGDGHLPVDPKIIRCEQCNMVQSLVYEYRGSPLGSVDPVMPTGPYPLGDERASIAYPLYPVCQCPRPEPAPKHDGKLDEDGHLTAQFKYGKYVQVRNSESEYGLEGGDRLFFNGKEFLSLLDWGEQNRTELQRLAKEQEG